VRVGAALRALSCFVMVLGYSRAMYARFSLDQTASLKKECVNLMPFATRTEAYDAIAHYVDGFYNPTRRHSTLGYVSPVRYE